MTTSLLNNRYQILKTLGQGGFGETFLAIDTHLPSGRKCVIKRLQPYLRSQETAEWLQERFQREAAILEELGEKHPQIPKLYAYFAENSQFYLVQEWIEGLTLTQLREKHGNLSENEVRQILISLLPILEFIHRRRLIHRDVKPDNIIIRNSDRLAILIDFGVIKEAITSGITNLNGKTPYTLALGTPGYMSSEQAAGRPDYSSDLYSLGLTAIFLLTGKSPQYLENDPNTGEINWRSHAPNLHSNLATTLDRAIRFDPRDRFSSAQAMLDALSAESPSGLPTLVMKPSPPPSPATTTTVPTTRFVGNTSNSASSEPEAESSWKQWVFLALLAFGLTAGAFFVGFKLFSRPRPNPTPSPVFTEPPPTVVPTPTRPSPSRSTAAPSPQPKPTWTSPPPVKPSPSPTIEPSPEPTVSPEPSPSPTIEPSPEPTISPEPSPTPTIEPSPEATISPEPSSTPMSNSTEQEPHSETNSPPATNGLAPPQPKRPVSSNGQG